jgi:hypothetical protein
MAEHEINLAIEQMRFGSIVGGRTANYIAVNTALGGAITVPLIVSQQQQKQALDESTDPDTKSSTGSGLSYLLLGLLVSGFSMCMAFGAMSMIMLG